MQVTQKEAVDILNNGMPPKKGGTARIPVKLVETVRTRRGLVYNILVLFGGGKDKRKQHARTLTVRNSDLGK